MKTVLLIIIMSISLWAGIGNIMTIRGSADVYRGSSSVVATNGMPLLEADKIKTAKKSRVQVMLKDDTVVTIGANSSFSFEEFKFDGTKNSKIQMRATRGFFRSVTGKIGKLAPERFKVKTASATIGIRGTDFSGNIFKGNEIFKCYQGKIFIKFENNVYDLSEGMMIEISHDNHQIKKISNVKKIESKLKIYKQKNITQQPNNLKNTSRKFITKSKIPTKVITDITRIVEETDFKEPFKITPNTADRQIKY